MYDSIRVLPYRMKILISETLDKSRRTFCTLTVEEVRKGIEQDNGWFEVIDMYDPDAYVRIYFDIDAYDTMDKEYVKQTVLSTLHSYFSTKDEDWAICFSPNAKKISYHIFSRIYKCTLRTLRALVKQMNMKWIDKSVYYYDRKEPTDEAYFRLPNQSKHSIHKEVAPFRMEQGDLHECLIGCTDTLQIFKI